jgi:hypothetical protein
LKPDSAAAARDGSTLSVPDRALSGAAGREEREEGAGFALGAEVDMLSSFGVVRQISLERYRGRPENESLRDLE